MPDVAAHEASTHSVATCAHCGRQGRPSLFVEDACLPCHRKELAARNLERVREHYRTHFN